MRSAPTLLAVALAAGLAQACSRTGGETPDSQLPEGQSFASCPAVENYVEGSSAAYRFERSDGTTEDVTVTVGETIGRVTTFALEGTAGAYTVTHDQTCNDVVTNDERPARAADPFYADPLARVLLSRSLGPVDDPQPEPTTSPNGEDVAVAPPDEPSCERTLGSEEVESVGDAEVNRCVVTDRVGADGEEVTTTTEIQREEPMPVAGLIFKESVRASGAVDRVRLIDWNGL